MMEGRFGIVTGCMIASGATALTFVTFLGALYPSAPNDEARLHLLIAAILPFFGFISAVLMATAAALFASANLGRAWSLAPQLAACAVNLAILVSVVNQTAAALGEWFDAAPGSYEGVDWLIRTGLALGVLFILAALTALSVRALRGWFGRKPSD